VEIYSREILKWENGEEDHKRSKIGGVIQRRPRLDLGLSRLRRRRRRSRIRRISD
jgi:hypothetical protein